VTWTGRTVTTRYADPADAELDDAALETMRAAYGDRMAKLPPVALVIAAYNEEGSIGPVVEHLPATACGLGTAVIVVADGCADGTVKEADVAGAIRAPRYVWDTG